MKASTWKWFGTQNFGGIKNKAAAWDRMANTFKLCWVALCSWLSGDKCALFPMLSSGSVPKQAGGGGQGWGSLLLYQRKAFRWKELLEKVQMRTLQAWSVAPTDFHFTQGIYANFLELKICYWLLCNYFIYIYFKWRIP